MGRRRLLPTGPSISPVATPLEVRTAEFYDAQRDLWDSTAAWVATPNVARWLAVTRAMVRVELSGRALGQARERALEARGRGASTDSNSEATATSRRRFRSVPR